MTNSAKLVRPIWPYGPLLVDGDSERLTEFAEWALSHIPYYRSMSSDRIPVVDRALYLDDITRFQPDEPPADHEVLTSSGTSGPPLRVAIDRAAWQHVNYGFFEQIRDVAGLSPDAFRPGAVSVMFVTNKPGRTSLVQPLPALNDSLYLRLQLQDAPARTIELFARTQSSILYGKPSYLLDLRRLLVEGGWTAPPWRPRLLLTSGESLYPDDRARLRDYFQAPTVDALASTEGGLIAATEPDDERYQVQSDNVVLEVADDAGPGPAGSGELLVTNLINRATAFWRYRSGDVAELHTDPGTGRQQLTSLLGRQPRELRFATGQVATSTVNAGLAAVPGLGDFALELGESGQPNVLRWCRDLPGSDPDAIAAGLRGALDQLVPNEAFVIDQVDRVTPLGGKKQRFGKSAVGARR